VSNIDRVIVIGLDGLEPAVVETLLGNGALPNMDRVRRAGSLSQVATTAPAQTPVAWSTFATGLNPGQHGIFDFLRRDTRNYLPELAFTRYECKNPLLPPKVVNLRRGKTVWDRLGNAGIPSVVLRCPCTYPPDAIHGRLLCGMGVPDLRGGLGSSTSYSSSGRLKGSENAVRLQRNGSGTIPTALLGPLHPKHRRPIPFKITIEPQPRRRRLVIRSSGTPAELEVGEGQWSDWLRMKFRIGAFQSIRGMVRFHLLRVEPDIELYASPVNFTPESPPFPVSSPPGYVAELAGELGSFYTTGMVEDHDALKDGRMDEETFLSQCDQAWREREAMMLYELNRFDQGLFFCLFDTPDRVQHMFWRFREPEHPANQGVPPAGFESIVDDQYRTCDTLIGKVLEYVDDRTLLIVLSDHGFKSFRRGVNLNTWLCRQGLMALKTGAHPGRNANKYLREVDWSRTKAYALGLGGVYLNRRGREAKGIVPPEEAESLQRGLASQLSGLPDPEAKRVAIRSACVREEIYQGPHVGEAPDVVVNFAEGYRASWSTAAGGTGETVFEDNASRWAGDHIVDPDLVPGMILMNRSFCTTGPALVDLAPTILDALAAPRPSTLEGKSLLT
jgi:predicted AlkP superfamily phosphohydrolase/phosphomutase